MLQRGLARQALDDLRGAEADLTQHLELRRVHDDADSLWLAQAQVALAECLAVQRRRPQARALLEAAQRIHAKHAAVAPQLEAELSRVRRLSPYAVGRSRAASPYE